MQLPMSMRYSNKNLVQYDVGFDKAGGNTKIRSFDVKLYGAQRIKLSRIVSIGSKI